jgi:uncharacterized membrane protein YhaH (DUF805 family)
MQEALSGLISLALAIAVVAGCWKVFTKAGEPGWAILIPIYNAIVLLKIAGKPAWWFLLLFVPLVNVVVMLIVNLSLAERFGKSAGFGVGLTLLGVIFYPILGFSDSEYQG